MFQIIGNKGYCIVRKAYKDVNDKALLRREEVVNVVEVYCEKNGVCRINKTINNLKQKV